MSSEPSLLLLIPAYNEEARIEPVLREFGEYFQKNYHGKFQLVVVLNGCKDNTLGVVRRVAAEYSFISALDFPDPIGKGGALIEGLRLAPNADLIGYVDADGASPPHAFYDLVKLTSQADCVIGSRWLPGSMLHQAQTRLRQFTSRCFHVIVESLFWMHIKDTQCPCKVARRGAIEKIHSNLRIADLAFDVNLLYSLKHAGFSVLEVPTEWTDKIGSKVTSSLFRSSLTMFLSVIRIRLIYSPFYKWLRPLRPLETWIYKKLRAPQPRPRPGDAGSPKAEGRSPNSEARGPQSTAQSSESETPAPNSEIPSSPSPVRRPESEAEARGRGRE
jgi:glycosyltransferase involved in cell wall biosynthesis